MRIPQEELDKIYKAMKSEKNAKVYKRYQSLYLFCAILQTSHLAYTITQKYYLKKSATQS